MIRFFPTPYPDEVLYSLIARFGKIMFDDNPIGLARCLFGNSYLRANIDLNSHLKVFLERTNSFLTLSESQLIHNYTLYPYYSCFLTEKEKTQVLSNMLSSSGQNIHTRIGINASRLKRSHLPKYCVLCYGEDVDLFGEAFWHRGHQIPGVDVCCHHDVVLNIYQPGCDQLGSGYYLAPPDKLNSKDFRKNNLDTVSYISKKSFEILLNQAFDINRVNYCDQLIAAGYSKNRQIDQAAIITKFNSFYGTETLNSLATHIGSKFGWIPEIIRRPSHIFNPVRHILFSKFCAELPLRLYPISNPFKEGPWICYNKASDHYLMRVVNNLKVHIDKKSKRQIGVFTCDCGMVYTMSFIENNNGLKKHVRVKDFGETWTLRLRAELQSGKSLREIARILGTDVKTVVLKSVASVPEENVTVPTTNGLDDRKQQWISFFKKDGSKSIKDARKKMPATYTLLYRHAKVWFLAFNASLRKTQRNQGVLKLDWEECDQIILAKLQDAIRHLNQSGFKGRLTKSLLAKIVGHESQLLNSNINKLPRSSDFIHQKVESKDQFQKRRISTAIKELRERSQPLKKWLVIRQSKLKHPVNGKIQRYTEEVIKSHTTHSLLKE